MKPQMWTPLLRLKSDAREVAESATVTYYTGSSFHLGMLEAEVERLDRTIGAFRVALQAARSRGEDPLADEKPPEVEVPW